MAKRIWVNNSKILIIAEDTNIADDKRNPTSNVYTEINGTIYAFYKKSVDELIETIDFADILDENGNAYTSQTIFTDLIESSDSIADVRLQDQHSQIVDLKLSRKLDDITLLANTNINDYSINIETTGAVPTPAMSICLKEGSSFYQGRPITITPIAGNQYIIELDTPLDFAFTTVSGCGLTDTNLAVDGSITPVVFSITPGGLNDGISWDITRFILLFGGDGIGAQNDKPDDGDFGVTSALTKGIVIRSINGIAKNIYNAKTNGDFRARSYDVAYTDASKAGIYSVAIRRSFAGTDKNGVTVRLNSDTFDTFEIIVQDDLTEMTGAQAVIQGHVVEF